MKFRKKPVVINVPQFVGNVEDYRVEFHLGDSVAIVHKGAAIGGGIVNAASRSVNQNGGIAWDLKFGTT